MNIRPLESLTKEELIELVKHEREHIAGAGKMAPTVKQSLIVQPTDSEMLDWLVEESCTVLSFATGVLNSKYSVIDFHGDDVSMGDTAREAIEKAMRGEE